MTKAEQTACEIAKVHNIDYAVALQITQAIYAEARRSLLKVIGRYGVEVWQKMSFQEKAAVCTEVVRGLVNKEAVANFIEGRKKSLI